MFGKFERSGEKTTWERLTKAWSALEERTGDEVVRFNKLGLGSTKLLFQIFSFYSKFITDIDPEKTKKSKRLKRKFTTCTEVSKKNDLLAC